MNNVKLIEAREKALQAIHEIFHARMDERQDPSWWLDDLRIASAMYEAACRELNSKSPKPALGWLAIENIRTAISLLEILEIAHPFEKQKVSCAIDHMRAAIDQGGGS